jgi:hypothetical protein
MIRIVEMAAEFPKVSCLGVDLAPNWAGRPEVPSNAKFEQCNAVEGIPYPDNTFDVVHSRLLVSGVSCSPSRRNPTDDRSEIGRP